MGGEAFSKLSALHHLNDGGVPPLRRERPREEARHLRGLRRPHAARAHLRSRRRHVGDGELLGVIPGGSSCPVLRPTRRSTRPTRSRRSPLARQERARRAARRRHVPQPRHDARHLLRDRVLATGTCPVAAMHNLMQFYRHESCGQCTPCREGTGWLDPHRRPSSSTATASMEELDQLHDIANGIMGNTICAFGEGTAMPALGFLRSSARTSRQHVRAEQAAARADRALWAAHERARASALLRALRARSPSSGALVTVSAQEPDPRRDGPLARPSWASPGSSSRCTRSSSRPSSSSSTRARSSSSSSS